MAARGIEKWGEVAHVRRDLFLLGWLANDSPDLLLRYMLAVEDRGSNALAREDDRWQSPLEHSLRSSEYVRYTDWFT